MITLCILIALWMLPIIIGWQKRHHNLAVIAIVTVFLSWTLVGWVVALAMAYQKPIPVKETEK